jgi:glucose/arabinose dehydrogenase
MNQFLKAFTLVSLLSAAACAQSAKPAQSSGIPNQDSAPGSGKRIIVKAESLPKPFQTDSVRNGPKVIPAPAGASLQLPSGFSASVFAEGDFKNPRWIIEGTNGDLFLSDARDNSVALLRDANKDGRIDNQTERFKFLTGLNRPFGMAIRDGYFFVANTDGVMRYKYQAGQAKIEDKGEKIIDLPAQGYNNHWTRNLLFSPDGKKLYVSVGSGTNVDDESADPRRAAISEYNADGTGHRIYAGGIRNPIGLAWNPITGLLWTAVNERDGLGDDLVPDYATSVKEGAFYGWPFSYMGKNEDPRRKGERPELVARAIVPDVLFEAHCAALGIAFYTGNMFPKEYQGDAFVALHGSWNRSLRHGYKIVRIPFKNGKPDGGYENFMTGWVTNTPGQNVWGRPVGLLMMSDGSLLVVDDGANKVWRITYKK